MTPGITQVFKAFIQKKGKLSDIEYLSIKEFGGKRVDVDAQQSVATTTETDLSTQTANASKDMYLGNASGSFKKGTATTTTIELRLYANAVLIEELELYVGVNGFGTYEFKTKGIKVDATQIIKITVKQDNANAIIHNSKLVLWEEDTGDSPQI